MTRLPNGCWKHCIHLAVVLLVQAAAPADMPRDDIARHGWEVFTRLGEQLDPLRNFKADEPYIHWGESYLLQAHVEAFEHTRDHELADWIIEHVDRVWSVRSDHVGVTDELRGRVVPGWCNSRYTNGRQHAHIVGTGMITYPIARWVYLVKSDPQLEAAYGERINRDLDMLIESVDAFDDWWRDGPSPGEGYYKDLGYLDEERSIVWMNAHKNGPDSGLYASPYRVLPLPFNQQNAIGRTYAMLWRITGEERFKQRAERIARFFKNRTRERDGVVLWPYATFSDGASVSDTSHATIDLDFVCVCFESGLVFDEADMQRMAALGRSLHDAERGFAQYIDGGRSAGQAEPPIWAWLKLCRFDPRLRELIYQRKAAQWDANRFNASYGPLAAIRLVTSQPDTPP